MNCILIITLSIYIVIFSKAKFVVSTGNSSTPLDHKLLKLYSAESDGTFKENDTTKYDLKKTGSFNNHLEYEFKSGGKCAAVMYGEGLVWATDPDNPRYPKVIYFHTDIMHLIVEFDKFYFTYKYKENKFDFVSKNDNSDFSENDLKFFTTDKTNSITLIEIDPKKYKIVSYYYVTRVIFYEDANCVEVKYNDKSVWKHSGYLINDVYPKMISYNISKRIFIDFNPHWYYVYKYDSNNDKWVLESKKEQTNSQDS